jgi:hypothetical protein
MYSKYFHLKKNRKAYQQSDFVIKIVSSLNTFRFRKQNRNSQNSSEDYLGRGTYNKENNYQNKNMILYYALFLIYSKFYFPK